MTEQTLSNGFQVYVAGNTESQRAVTVIQEAFGVNGHIRSVVDRFAEAGYFAIAPHLFHRDGSPEIAYDDFPSAMKYMANLSKEGLTNDLTSTTNFLATLGYGSANIGIVGYCMGGTVAFYAATTGTVGAAVSFYGGGVENGRFGLGSLIELAPSLACPWLGLYGDLDAGIPVEQVEALRTATASSDYPTDIIRYADADHGFHCEGRPNVYNDADARDAHQRALNFLSAQLSDR